MKKNFIIIAALAATSLMVSCQKDSIETVDDISFVRQTLVIDDALTKSIYEPGKGVHFTGRNEEAVSVFYADHNDLSHKLKKVLPMKDPIYVKFLSLGEYEIAHPKISSASTYDYFCVLNGCLSDIGGKDKNMIASQVFSFQEPKDGSFDPSCDPLICKPISNVNISSTLHINDYKRLTAPLKLVLKDSGNKLAGAKVHMVTLSSSQDKDNKTYYPFAGTCYISLDPSGNFENNKIETISSDAWSNNVTANYHNGKLFKDSMDVWYSIYPTTLKANTELTLIVTTDTKTISRKVSLPSDVVVKAGQLNTLSFDISGQGECTEVESICQSFTSFNNTITNPLTASDGNTHKWEFTGFKHETGKQTLFSNSTQKVFPEGVCAAKEGTTLKYPTDLIPAGKTISKVRIYLHPKDKKKSIDNTNRQNNKDVIVLTEAEHSNQADWQKSFTTTVPNTTIAAIVFEFN